MKINWKKIENLYVNAAKKFLKYFGKEHPHEYFYGISLDGDAVYWSIMMSLNTEPLLLKRAEECKLRNADLYKDQTIEQMLEKYRWSPGDWGYIGEFEPTIEEFLSGKNPGFVKEYVQLMMKSREYTDSLDFNDPHLKEIHEQLQETMCRIVIRLEDEKAFEHLNLSKNFRAICGNDDETAEHSQKRLDKIRRKVKQEQKLTQQSNKPRKTVSKKNKE